MRYVLFLIFAMCAGLAIGMFILFGVLFLTALIYKIIEESVTKRKEAHNVKRKE